VGTQNPPNPDDRLSDKRLGVTGPDVAPKSTTLRALKAKKVPRPPELALVRRNSFEQTVSPHPNPSISIISSFLRPTIPPEPWIPLSFLGEDKLQVRFHESGATDLDMKLCVLNQKPQS